MSVVIPEEIVMEILSSLPPKSLMRFKCVCKPWCALFNSSSYMAKHLLPNHNHDDDNLLLLKYSHKTTHRYAVSLLSGRTFVKHEPLLLPRCPDAPHDDDVPYYIEILASCNHLMCIQYGHQNPRIALWSLPTGDVKFLPPSHVPDRPSQYTFGFGYDAVSQEYKVIQITRVEGNMGFGKVEIYSDSWRGILCDGLPATLRPRSYYTRAYTDGIFSWFATHPLDDYCNWVLWFRFSDESFGAFMLPPNRFHGEHYGTEKFLLLNDRLGIVIYDKNPDLEERYFRVWVLLEFGVEDSWTLLFTLGPLPWMDVPLWCWNNGKMIMQNNDGQFVLCDPFGQEIKPLGIDALTDDIRSNIQIISIPAK